MKYELTNTVMEERGRMGLSVWVCRYLHTLHHEERCRSYDSHWGILSKECKCHKCKREWIDLSPLTNVMNKQLCELLTPAIYEILWEKDPIYNLIAK